MTATGNNGSSITSVIVTGNDLSDTNNITPATTVNKTVESDTLSTSGVNTYTVTIIDSRGRTNTHTVQITVVPYQFPNISSLFVERWDTSSSQAAPAGT